MKGWFWLDAARNRKAALPNTVSNIGADHTWFGIRKGGRLWARTQRVGAFELIVWYDPQPALPKFIFAPAIPTYVTYAQAGLTNNKKHFVISAVDLGSAVNVDRLQHVSYNGDDLGSYPVSDGSINRNRQLVYLEHDYYVLGQEPDSWYVKVYDARANFIRKWALFPHPAGQAYGGITTDGKHLYFLVQGEFSNQHHLEKWTVRGELIWDFRLGPGDDQFWRSGLSFNGRYLLALRP